MSQHTLAYFKAGNVGGTQSSNWKRAHQNITVTSWGKIKQSTPLPTKHQPWKASHHLVTAFSRHQGCSYGWRASFRKSSENPVFQMSESTEGAERCIHFTSEKVTRVRPLGQHHGGRINASGEPVRLGHYLGINRQGTSGGEDVDDAHQCTSPAQSPENGHLGVGSRPSPKHLTSCSSFEYMLQSPCRGEILGHGWQNLEGGCLTGAVDN